MRIAIYVRVSTPRQVQAQTIDQQLDQLQAYIAAQGWTVPADHIFRDDGFSGASLNRPGLDRLRALAAAAELDRVILTAPDRLARNYVHQMLLLDELTRAGCQVEFLDRPLSQDPHDHLVLQIRGAVAEYERSVIAERMRRGRQLKLRAGLLLPWTRPPYGYRVDPDRPRDPAGVHLDSAEAATVQHLFARYLEDGVSLIGLAKELGTHNVPTPRGSARWNLATLRGILTNPCYTGQLYAGRMGARPAQVRRSATHPIGQPTTTRVLLPQEPWIPVATIPAVITQDQFDRVQAKLAHNKQFAPRNNTIHTYLLRALVSCGVCQAACNARTEAAGYGYYVCRAKGHPIISSRDHKCTARFIPARQLDDVVWQDLCALVTDPGRITQALERAHGGHWLPQELHARRETLRKAQVGVEHQIERLTDAYLAEVIPLAEYQRRRSELGRKQQALGQQLQQLAVHVDRQAELAALAASMTDFCERVQAGLATATFAQRRQLVELLIDRVVVANEEVEIRYVLPTSPAGEHTRFCHLRKDYFDLPPHPQQHHGFGPRQVWSRHCCHADRPVDQGQGSSADSLAFVPCFLAKPPPPLIRHLLRHPHGQQAQWELMPRTHAHVPVQGRVRVRAQHGQQVQGRAIHRGEGGLGIPAREHEAPLRLGRGDLVEAEIALVCDAQRAGGQHHVLNGRVPVIGSPLVQSDPLQLARRDVPQDLDLQRGGAPTGAPATAAPQGGQAVGERDGGAIEHIDPLKALEDGDGGGFGGHDLLDGGFEHMLTAAGRRRREALSQALRRDGESDIGGTLGELFQRRLGMGKEAKDQGLNKARAGEVALTTDESGRGGDGGRHSDQDDLQGGCDLWYRRHKRLLRGDVCFDTHIMPERAAICLS